MTERWKDELRKLREVRPTADLDARIAEGPRPEPPPPASRRVVAAVTAFALFAAAGAFAFIVLREDGSNGAVVGGGEDPRLVLGLVSTDLAPTATLRYGDDRIDVVTEGYTWCDGEECSSLIADFAFYPPVGEYLVVPPGTPIEVTGDGAVGDLLVTDPDGERITGANHLVVPDANGRFVFQLTGEFERGQGHFFFGVQAIDGPSSAPDVISIDCSTGTTRSDTAIVRTQADGLHVIAAGMQGWDGLEIVSPAGTPPDEVSAFGTGLPGDGAAGWPIAPGRWEIACATSDRPVEAGDGTVPFELVDPDDHWAPVISCRGLGAMRFTTTIPSSVPHEDAAGQLLGGLVDGDRIRGAGYGAERWKPGFTYVVERDGQAVAQLELFSPQSTYEGAFRACPESGIELTTVASMPAPKVQDVLVLRCEGLGPAVDASTVRLQPDGLHIEASNIADATAVAVDSQSGEIESFVAVEFDSVTEDIVLDLPSGTYWIGCRVPNEQGQIEGGHEEFPDAYVEVTVLPVE